MKIEVVNGHEIKALSVHRFGWKRIAKNMRRFGWEIDTVEDYREYKVERQYTAEVHGTDIEISSEDVVTNSFRATLIPCSRKLADFENLEEIKKIERWHNFIYGIRNLFFKLRIPATIVLLAAAALAEKISFVWIWSIYCMVWLLLRFPENLLARTAEKKLRRKKEDI